MSSRYNFDEKKQQKYILIEPKHFQTNFPARIDERILTATPPNKRASIAWLLIDWLLISLAAVRKGGRVVVSLISTSLPNVTKTCKNQQKPIRRSKNKKPPSTIENPKHNMARTIMRGRRCLAAGVFNRDLSKQGTREKNKN